MDALKIKKDFPILSRKIFGKELVYLDNAATTQSPEFVLKKTYDFSRNSYSNINRGVHTLSEEATEAVESAREKIKKFINAEDKEEIIFTSGATESINLLANALSENEINEGDNIVITEMEHHSNLAPWRRLCDKKKCELRYVPIDDKGNLKLDSLNKILTNQTKLLAFTYVSNVTGCVNKVEEIVKIARSKNVPTLIDAAQAISRIPIDVKKINCDYLAFSGHKTYAQTGIGVLYGKKALLDSAPPYKWGGGMIDKVTMRKVTPAASSLKFEAGTVNIIGAVSLGAAIDYLNKLGMEKVYAHDKEIYEYAKDEIKKIKGVQIYGETENMQGSISFNIENAHPYDVGMILDKMGIAVRTGHHCAQPLMNKFKINGAIRASFAVYNSFKDAERLVEGVNKAREML